MSGWISYSSLRNLLSVGALVLPLALLGCSHEGLEAREAANAKAADTPVIAKKPEAPVPDATLPVISEPTNPESIIVKPAANESASNEVAVLKPGQTATIDASTSLQYVKLVSDSRCPVDAQCIWAGEATIELTLMSGKETQNFNLTDRANKKSLMGFDIELMSIDRSHLINIRVRKV